MSDRSQAIKDVADSLASAERTINLFLLGHLNTLAEAPSIIYAVSQRERVIALERALREIADDDPECDCIVLKRERPDVEMCNSCKAHAALEGK